MLTTFQLIPARRWFRPVDDVRALTMGGQEGMFVARPAFVESLDPPDFFADPAEVAGIGDGRPLGYALDDFRLSVDDAFLAALDDARVEKMAMLPFPSNTYHLFVAPSLALAETQHDPPGHAHMMRHLGEETEARLEGGGTVRITLRELREPDQHVRGEALLLAARFTHFNYFHWMIDLLPRLSFLDLFERPDRVELLLPDHRLTGFQRETLEALGLRNPMRGLNCHLARIDRLYVPSFFAPGGYSRQQMAWLSERLRRAFGVLGRPAGGRRLWLSRADAKWRGVGNEAEVVRLLKSRGFETVVPGRMTVAEQARLFAEAGIVVAPHGAGNTNMLFAPAGAILIEVIPSSCPNNCYYMLTKLNGQRYGRILDPAAEALGGVLTVDLDKLAAVVDQALAAT